MDITALKIFKAVAEAGGVTRAAERLHYVQSNVTARLKQLEQDVGTPLFHRQNRKMIITPAGEILLGYAERIIRLAEEARLAVSDTAAPRGALTIGTMETTAASRLPSILPRYHERYPEVELNLQTGTTRELVEAVLELKLPAALVAAPLSHPDIEQDIVFEEELVLITERRRATLCIPRDLANQTLLVFRQGCMYRSYLERWLASMGVVARRIMDFGAFDAIVGCVAGGMGMSLMPRSIVEHHRQRDMIDIVTLPPEYALAPTLLIRRRDVVQTSALRAWRQMLLDGDEPALSATSELSRVP